jgi:hypothetical protein
MKKTLILLLIVAAFILESVMVGIAAEKLRVSVPFAFYAGTKLLPAGNYLFEMPHAGSDIMTVRTENGSVFCLVARLRRTDAADELPRAVFHGYGQTHFLEMIHERGIEVDLTQTRTEKELLIAPLELADKDKPQELVSQSGR